MALRMSTALSRFIMNEGSLGRALSGGTLRIFSGGQPAHADLAETGDLLAVITDSGLSHVNETQAYGSIEITGGSSAGGITSLTIGGIEVLGETVTGTDDLDLAQTLAARLGVRLAQTDFFPVWDGDRTVTIVCKPNCGDRWNSAAIIATMVTLGATTTTIDGGVWHGNGLRIGSSFMVNTPYPYALKDGAQTWSGVGLANGDAGWFRFCGPIADHGGDDTQYQLCRLDGSIGTSGANMIVNKVAVTVSEDFEIATFNPGPADGPAL